MPSSNPKPTDPSQGLVLVVDDENQSIEAIRRDLARTDLINPVFSVSSGKEAIEYLEGTGRFKDRFAFPLPSLLLVDWRMPVISGQDIVRFVRSQLKFVSLPIVVLTASTDLDDMRDAYNAGATSFLVKPLSTYNIARLLGGLLAR